MRFQIAAATVAIIATAQDTTTTKAEILFPVEEKFWYMSIIMEPKDFSTEGGILTIGALKEMAEWEQKMRDIVEWESTTIDEDTNSITRDEWGPYYQYEDICQQQKATFTFYENEKDLFGNDIYDRKGDVVKTD